MGRTLREVKDVITQDELEEIVALKKDLADARELVRTRLKTGAPVSPGRLSATIESRTKAIPVKRYREWLVGATSEGSVSRREKLTKRGEYTALVVR